MTTRGAITLVFDDGYQAVYDEVLPLLARYKIRAVFAVPLEVSGNTIAGQNLASVSAWQKAAKKYGHELAAHGITHANMTALSDTDLQKELREPASALPTQTLVYPGGAHDERVATVAREYYTAARTVIRGYETLPPTNPMKLSTINFSTRNFSVIRANIHAVRTWIQGRWLIETYHMASKLPSTLSHSVLLDELEAHLSFITSLPVRIATIQDLL